jgi:protein-ribulosamine 3-kinase
VNVPSESARSVRFRAALAAAIGRKVATDAEATVHGGCINDCYCWSTARGPVFVKRTPLDRRWLLDAERDGLERLRAAGAVRVPVVLGEGTTADEAFLALEWLELRPADGASDARLGAALARQHVEARGAAFGLERDNAIGATPQQNGWYEDWTGFWRDRRLGVQLELAARSGSAGRLQDRGRRLLQRVGDFFSDYRPMPALLHGDLWNGNRARIADGTPVVFDPAVYYGDPEADLAMTRLFGGFGRDFYAAYHAVLPPDPGSAARIDLYNLYHVLNHLNLFGGGYRAQADAMIDRLLAAAGT